MLTSRGHVVACFDLKYFPPTMSRSTKATRGSVRHIGEHPAWLLDRLLYARLRRTEEGALMLIVEAEDTVGSHLALATLHPRLVRADGREVPLTVVEHTRTHGLPLRCVVRADERIAFDALDNVDVVSLRLSLGERIKDLEITNARPRTPTDGAR